MGIRTRMFTTDSQWFLMHGKSDITSSAKAKLQSADVTHKLCLVKDHVSVLA